MLPEPDAATVLFLHPGAMGSRMAGECRARRRLWVADGRSKATLDRARNEGLEPVAELSQATSAADLVVSICPPAAAVDTARRVAATGYRGLYLDANAVAPTTMARVVAAFGPATAAGPAPAAGSTVTVVDGGVIGPPPTTAGSTRLYVACPEPAAAEWVAGLWDESNLDVRMIHVDPDPDPDPESESAAVAGAATNRFAASALKMSYAAWTKGSAALLATVAAAASAMGVADALTAEWGLSQPGLSDRAGRGAAAVGPKAWRFAGEMTEIATAFDEAGVPSGFWTAATEVYERLTPLRDRSATLDGAVPNPATSALDEVIELLVRR